MYSILNDLLSDKKGAEVFTCFGAWHFVYIFLAVGLAVGVITFLKGKGQTIKSKAATLLINVAFGLYVADFFLMPFAYGEIDIEKLPFHICTVTCVLSFVSRRGGWLSKYRIHIALLAFISNLVYLIYPAGVMWHQVHPLSYRVVQTLAFHVVMTVYGLVTLIFDEERPTLRTFYKNLIVLGGVTVWAMLGNLLYNGTSGEYNHFFNWFFVVRDPFYLLPESISPYIMPLIDIALFSLVELVIYFIVINAERKRKDDRKSSQSDS